MKIALQHYGSNAWIAGNWILSDLLLALRSLGEERPETLLVVNASAAEADYARLRPLVDDVLLADFSPPAPLPQPPWLTGRESLRRHALRALRRRLGHRPPPRPAHLDHPLARRLPERGVDCFFSAAWRKEPLPTVPHITWIYDFQHRRLPDLFSGRMRRERDEIFCRQAESAAIVLVTADDVLRDFQAFAPQYADKGRVIRLAAAIDPAVYDDDLSRVLTRYHLPEKFFFLPNQLWRHKNHQLVVAALERLRGGGIRPVVVCGGAMIDQRQPEYVGSLIQQLSLADVRDQFILLGQLPRYDVFALMRQSIAVMNPSLFEGLGMSVAEARSLGKSLLLSDLPVLREQDAPGALYFDPHDADDLAAKMADAWQTLVPGPDLELERRARAELPARQQAFGRAFMALVTDAIERWSPPSPDGGRR
jgi:glycosyltransferase involved in cell wall biosynthesis